MSNRQIAKLFRDIAAAYFIKDENRYRFQITAYQNASEIINNLTTELKDFYKQDSLNEIPGIGKTIKSRLEELFKTGSVKHFDWVKKNIPKSVFVLLDIPTFGPKKAYKLASEFKLNNPENAINKIKDLAKKNKIAKIERFGEKSEQDIIRAIDEYMQGKGKLTRMNLPYATQAASKIVSYLKKQNEAKDIEILGSLRRKKETIGDIDIAVATNNPEAVLEYFTKYPGLERILEKGKLTASILISGGIQIDLMTQPPESFGSLLQHLTGSKDHNVKLREIALKKDLSLSEHGIKSKKTKKIQKFNNEKSFYNSIGLDWIPPEIREDHGEIELAAKHKLPNLIKLKDVKGDLHIHSNFPIEPSHDLGSSTMEEILKQARNNQYEYIGLAEHNPSISKHTPKQCSEIIKKRNEIIEQKNKSKNNVRIFKLLEVDILPNGKIPLDENSAKLLDGIIVSVHSSFYLSKNDMTKRILHGLSHPKAKILGHPTGRILNERPAYEIDWDQILDFCRKENKAIEINSWPKRLDPPSEIVKLGVENKVKFVINTDSHAKDQMDLMTYGVSIARRGWATKDDIINTLSYNKFNKWLKGGD